MIDCKKLETFAGSFGVLLDKDMLKKMDIYAELLLEHNKKVNLTAITEPNEVMIKHFLDSLTVVPIIKEAMGNKIFSLIDVGTGAGFPGVVIAIAMGNAQITLLDSIGKKIDFLISLCDKLELKCDYVCERAEIVARKDNYREKFDIAVSRAVANLNMLSEYCVPFVKVGGSFIAMKGAAGRGEAEAAKNALDTLGLKTVSNEELILPDNNRRIILNYKKTIKTPDFYPRKSAQIGKKPL